jgi:hypothetical protein
MFPSYVQFKADVHKAVQAFLHPSKKISTFQSFDKFDVFAVRVNQPYKTSSKQ